VQIEKK